MIVVVRRDASRPQPSCVDAGTHDIFGSSGIDVTVEAFINAGSFAYPAGLGTVVLNPPAG